MPAHGAWFGEDQGRYVLEVTPQDADDVIAEARLLALPARVVGRTGGKDLQLPGEAPLPLDELRTAHERWFPEYMGAQGA